MEDSSCRALIQCKQDLIKAVKAQQYTAAADILQQALALSPGDALLLEFAATVHAKVDQDGLTTESSDDDATGQEEKEAENDCSSCSDDDSSLDNGQAGSTEAESYAEDDDGSDDETLSDVNGEDVQGPGSSSRSSSHHQQLHGSAGEAATAAAVVTILPREARLSPQDSNVQELNNSDADSALAQQAGKLPLEVSCIQLAAGCCTLTPQRRAELREQLAAAINKQQMALVRQRLVQDDPLLAVL